ncbi:MAG TPA: conjugal transfer protein TraX [Candidatus Fournierella excrementavium]|uniref:TraX family protein n=1 Tax=Candidatus Allofournierella excrementavium TaxID=2838591 RepID=UPI001F8FF821|nr:conjugal transfer protein TraX [Candidatus Fournierella excrementavium]
MKNKPELTSFDLHLLAMGLMLCDHICLALMPDRLWMTCVGRLAFPIFAFLVAEGFIRTRSRARYARRLLVVALVSEVPFDLLAAGRPVYPLRQNVLWTFLIALGCMQLLEWAKADPRPAARFVLSAGAVLGGFLAGTAFMVDYFGPGVWTVLVFYFFRGDGWRQRLGQLLCLLFLNGWLLAGQTVLPGGLALPIQAFAVLALPFIWLYRGRQGPHGRAVRWLFYGFYPAHLLVLAAAAAFAN